MLFPANLLASTEKKIQNWEKPPRKAHSIPKANTKKTKQKL